LKKGEEERLKRKYKESFFFLPHVLRRCRHRQFYLMMLKQDFAEFLFNAEKRKRLCLVPRVLEDKPKIG